MQKDYKDLSDAGLEDLLQKTQNKLLDAEDELDILNGQSQSGQHMSSEYFQSNYRRIEQKIESLYDAMGEIKTEIKNRKNCHPMAGAS